MPDILEAIRGFEGFTPRAQWDYKQNSNGYGTRAQFPGEEIDRGEAERRLSSEVENARGIVEKFAPGADEGTKAALTSLTYNAGDAWTRSGLGQAIQAGDMGKARELFVQYNKAGGAYNQGLANRRASEVGWFGGDATPQTPAQPQQAGPLPTPQGDTETQPSAGFGGFPDEIRAAIAKATGLDPRAPEQQQRQASATPFGSLSGGQNQLAEDEAAMRLPVPQRRRLDLGKLRSVLASRGRA